MAATSILTLSEISAKISDAAVQQFVEDWAELPSGVDVAEFLAKFLQAAYVAQQLKNADNTGAVAGELLALISAPATQAPVTNTALNVLTYSATYSVNVVSAIGQDLTVANYA